MKFKYSSVSTAGIIAALYVLLTLLSAAFGLSSGPVQVRFSELLCILPVFTPAAVPGLFIGCLLSNLLTGGVIFDVIAGSAATLIGAVGTRLLKKHHFLSLLPPLISNMLIVPAVLIRAYHLEKAYLLLVVSVFAGELISCVLLGSLFYPLFQRIFRERAN